MVPEEDDEEERVPLTAKEEGQRNVVVSRSHNNNNTSKLTVFLFVYAMLMTFLCLLAVVRKRVDTPAAGWNDEKLRGDQNNTITAKEATRGPSLCTRYLDSITPASKNTHAPPVHLSPIEQSLRPVLLPHCQQRPYLRIEDYLPDLEFFRPLALALHGASSIRALIAGRGTTGTHTLQNDWANKAGFANLHWRFVHNCNQEPAVKECISGAVNEVIDATRKSVPKQLYGRPNVTYEEYRSVILDPYANGFATIFGACGHCRHPFVVGDNPYTYMFTELYFASGPDTRVVYSRRDAGNWTTRRQQEHGKEQLCRPPWRTEQDPFSMAQCTSRQLTSVGRENPDVVRRAFQHYEAYVHRLVPGNFLLDLNLFTSSVLDNGTATDATIREQWTNDLKRAYFDFLGAPS